jgi:hypothetical protein
MDSMEPAPGDSGFLHEGGRSQQPGTAAYNKDVTAKEVASLLSTN